MNDIKNNKLTFAIEDAKLIKENPNSSFSIVSLDFFASGNNLHNLFISEDTLMKTANTIKNCPVVWLYDPVKDDATTHDDKEIACGFVPESAEITNRRLEDRRIMLTVTSYIWKKFSGRVLEIFSRDGEKPISVEINVFDSKEREDGLIELLDYKFEAVTILSSLVKPAIPLAKATVLEFAREYQEAIEREFFSNYKDLDFTIPSSIKKNANKSLELSKYHKIGLNSVTLSNARFLSKSEIATPEKVRNIYKFLNSNKSKIRNNKNPDRDYLEWIAHGGDESFSWSKLLVESMNNVDNKNTTYFEQTITFPYSKIEDINPALKGIEPPVSLGQANQIAKEADGIGAENGGWGISISNFKKRHKVVDGHWVKKEKMDMEFDAEKDIGTDKPENKKEEVDMADEKDKEKVKEEEKETPEEEKKESPEKEKEEQKNKEEKKEEPKEEKKEKMSLDSALDVKALLSFLEDETESYQEMATEFEKPVEEVNYAKVSKNLFCKMCKMAESIKKMSEENKTYMSENEELKKFKADIEGKQFDFAVKTVLDEVSDFIPKDELAKLKDESAKYTNENVENFVNLVKSKALDFSKKKTSIYDGITRAGFPFSPNKKEKSKSVWGL